MMESPIPEPDPTYEKLFYSTSVPVAAKWLFADLQFWLLVIFRVFCLEL